MNVVQAQRLLLVYSIDGSLAWQKAANLERLSTAELDCHQLVAPEGCILKCPSLDAPSKKRVFIQGGKDKFSMSAVEVHDKQPDLCLQQTGLSDILHHSLASCHRLPDNTGGSLHVYSLPMMAASNRFSHHKQLSIPVLL